MSVRGFNTGSGVEQYDYEYLDNKPEIPTKKSDIGLGNVDNTSDLDKPISNATQTALDGKVPNDRKVNGKVLSADVTLTSEDIGYDASTAYGSGTVGKELSELNRQISYVEESLGKVYDARIFQLSGSPVIYPYTFVHGKKYYVTNKTNGVTAQVRTCVENGDIIEWVSTAVTYDNTIEFIPEYDASYFRIYSAAGACNIEIATDGSVLMAVESEIKDAKSEILNEPIAEAKRHKNWELYRKPSDFSKDIPIKIFTDGHSYITDYNKENYKNNSAHTYYVSPNVSDYGNGTRTSPWKRVHVAVTNAADGDTIILLEGDYDRNTTELPNVGSIKKSLNIIGEGKVRVFNGDWCTFSAVSGYTNVYKCTRASGLTAYEVDSVSDEIVLMTLVGSIADVETTVGSYYKDGNDYYVHPLKSGTPNSGGAKIFITVDYLELFSFDNSERNVKAYLENFTVIGSTKTFRFDKQSADNTLDVCLDHVNMMWCGYNSRNSLEVYGGNVIINECKIFGSYRDGFNYCGTDTNGVTYRDSMIIELNCEASNCGIGRTETNMNGSTGHRNSKIVRVNCSYHDNHGPNCCDVQADTQSIILGCIAYNSTAEADAVRHNFDCQTEGAKMWLENCIGVGAYADFYCPSDGSMYMNKCSYDTKSGSGITETNPVTPMEWMLRNYTTSEQLLRQ